MDRARRFRWDRLALCVCMVFIAWVALSYCNIVLHNTEANPMYCTWNFFTVLF